ncbi:uncharacterized histidine-rich protein DDB_G0274557-like [Rhodamnia argentea]|uniref:Uncharacterized histidine-rich protein DDB_G0274557-like n=1 Tax=Rhodamnia argentea TaxID=178133 RepID=A0A8B8MTI0_9MYRT|nr:uncharacterized histidine-rich protein DDB_G0274557-like [Rhodamnia argentea]
MSHLTYFLVLPGVAALAATTTTDAGRNLLDKESPSELLMPRPRLDPKHPSGHGHPDCHVLEEGPNNEHEQRPEPEKKQPPCGRPLSEHNHDHDDNSHDCIRHRHAMEDYQHGHSPGRGGHDGHGGPDPPNSNGDHGHAIEGGERKPLEEKGPSHHDHDHDHGDNHGHPPHRHALEDNHRERLGEHGGDERKPPEEKGPHDHDHDHDHGGDHDHPPYRHLLEDDHHERPSEHRGDE